MRYYIQTTDFIAHHGILGMHWGVRRYQNPDGSLTEAGKKKYTKTFEKAYGEYSSAKGGYGKYHRMNKAQRDDAIKQTRAKAAKTIAADKLMKAGKSLRDDRSALSKSGKNGRDYDDEFEYVRPEASKEYKKNLNKYIKDSDFWNRTVDSYFIDTKSKNRAASLVSDLLDEEESKASHKSKAKTLRLSNDENFQADLMNEVNRKSGDKYFGEGGSRERQAVWDKQRKLKEQYDADSRKIKTQRGQIKRWKQHVKKNDELQDKEASIVLKDLGYKDTVAARKYLIDNGIFNID